MFVEEHPDSLNDPMFILESTGPQWFDFPGSLHHGSAWFAMADGHVELRSWENPATTVPVRFDHSVIRTPTSEDDPDLLWVRERLYEPLPSEDDQ